jgi:hypothetical protein
MNTKNLYDMYAFPSWSVREPDDEDADLDSLPRGDEFKSDDDDKVDTGAEDAKAVAGQMRDEHGKFVKAEPTEEEKAAAAAAADGQTEEEKAAAAAAAGEDDDKTDKDNYPIRLNKAHEQRDAQRARAEAAEARALAAEAKLRETEKPAPKREDPIAKINAELDELYVKAEELRQAGDVAEAAKVQRTIDSKNRDIGRIEAAQVAGAATTAAQINARYDAMLDVVEANVPLLDPQHEDYDKSAVKKLDFHVQAYEKMGMSPVDALKEAIGLLHPDHGGLFDRAKKPAAKAAPDDKPAPTQRKADPAKAVDTSRRQAPDGANKGANKDDTKIRAGALSEEDFDAIPLSKQREMRGDFA